MLVSLQLVEIWLIGKWFTLLVRLTTWTAAAAAAAAAALFHARVDGKGGWEIPYAKGGCDVTTAAAVRSKRRGVFIPAQGLFQWCE